MQKIIGLIYFLFLVISNNQAQIFPNSQKHADTLQTLDEIIIQANRIQIPFSKQNRNISIITKETIKTLPVKSVGELLQYVAGIDVRQRGPAGVQADIGIDGGSFDQTLVLLNGSKITDPQTGHNMMNLPVSAAAIERIEILRGAAARIYGVNALNGAINIITRQPQHTGIDIDLYSGSSFNKDTSNGNIFASYGVDITAGLSSKKINQFFAISQAQSSGYRYNTAFTNQKVFYQNSILPGKGSKVNFMAGYVNNEFGANAFYAAPADVESMEHVQTAITALSAVIPVNKSWIFRPRISYRFNKDDYIFKRHNPSYYRNIHKTNSWDIELNNTIKSGIGDFGFGVEGRNESIRSNSLGKRSRMNYGLFGEYSFNRIARLLINAGAYINYNSDFGWEFLPGLDAGYDLSQHFRIFANTGMGQRLPTFTDLYYSGPSNIGNPQLQPEESFQSEIGLKYRSSPINISVSYFHKNISQFIDWVKDSLTAPWQPQNYQKMKTNGLTFLSDFLIIQNRRLNWSTEISYTWLQPKITSIHPEKLSHYALNSLRNQVSLNNRLNLFNKYHLSVSARYQERIQYKSYFLLDTKFTIDLKQFNLYVEANNLTNISYVEAGAVPLPGIWITAGAKWSFRATGK